MQTNTLLRIILWIYLCFVGINNIYLLSHLPLLSHNHKVHDSDGRIHSIFLIKLWHHPKGLVLARRPSLYGA